MNKIRLFVDHTLGEAQSVPLNKDQAHYIFSVMRKRTGDLILIFDGNNGEWLASINEISKKNGNLLCIKQTKPQINPPDLWLYFSPLKKTRTDFIIEKATELGVRKIIPIQTEHTNADRIRIDRLNAHAREAAEQCGGTYIPKILELQKLNEALKNFPSDRKLLFCDEELKQSKVKFKSLAKGKWSILIGPEGGFSDIERNHLLALEFTHRISLGPRGLAIIFAGLGLNWILNSFGTLHTIGYGVLLTGMVLAYASYQRTRFKRTETGTGIVEFIEGQISYFGPETGAIFSINDIKRLILDKSKYSSKWIIENTAGYQIEIPTNVEGHEVLFDVFNSLEGFPIHKMLETLSSKQSIRTVLWQK